MKKLITAVLAALMLMTACSPVGKVDTPVQHPPEIQPEETPEAPQTTPEESLAKSILEAMTPEEKVGQMFLARCPQGDAASHALEYSLGGYILFGRDFEGKTRQQATDDIAACQQAAKVPMLIAVDEEGGTVNRVSRSTQFRSTPFRSPSQLYSEGGFDLIQIDTAEKCRLLSSLGINVNMAPVCDVTLDSSAFMYKRAFGVSAEMTSRYVRNVVSVMSAENMGSVLKHFPGYGDADDSHMSVTYDSREAETFYTQDFLPFKEGIASGAGAVLVCHNIVTAMDDQNPASLSPKVHQILREELAFDGVVMTDDLYMDAIRDSYDAGEAAVLAILAGNDVICCTEYDLHIPAVLEAVASGRIPQEQIDQSVTRILLWKISLGIIK